MDRNELLAMQWVFVRIAATLLLSQPNGDQLLTDIKSNADEVANFALNSDSSSALEIFQTMVSAGVMLDSIAADMRDLRA